jgi:uncharacterized membrane protein YGL010W
LEAEEEVHFVELLTTVYYCHLSPEHYLFLLGGAGHFEWKAVHITEVLSRTFEVIYVVIDVHTDLNTQPLVFSLSYCQRIYFD